MRLVNADSLETHEIYEGEWVRVVYADDIDNAPTIEAEPVVRCEDCEFYTAEERWCRRLGLVGAFGRNDYCSHAERSVE